MANLFDDANAPETEPATIVVGDQVKWKRTDLGTDYPNTAYSLRYSSRLEGAGSSKGLSSKLARAGLRSERRNVGKKVCGWVGIVVVTADTTGFTEF